MSTDPKAFAPFFAGGSDRTPKPWKFPGSKQYPRHIPLRQEVNPREVSPLPFARNVRGSRSFHAFRPAQGRFRKQSELRNCESFQVNFHGIARNTPATPPSRKLLASAAAIPPAPQPPVPGFARDPTSPGRKSGAGSCPKRGVVAGPTVAGRSLGALRPASWRCDPGSIRTPRLPRAGQVPPGAPTP